MSIQEKETPLVELRDLEISYTTSEGQKPVVHGVSLQIRHGQRVAIVGESGSGKSTVAASIISLLAGTGKVTGGTISYEGEDITRPTPKRLLALRGRQIGYVPQDPMSNLNPVARVGKQIAETLMVHGLADKKTASQRAEELMADAGIPEPHRRFRQFPHEFSGGMRQRVLIAIGLACQPQLLIADEPTSALDVTVQRQILDNLESLIRANNTSLLFITHDLGLAADRADHILVMHHGDVVEQGTPREILLNPQHPYTKSLVEAAPSVVVSRQDWSVEALDGARSVDGVPVDGVPEPETEVPLVEVKNLVKEYKIRGAGNGTFRAVDDVSFTIARKTTTAIVGESGSGKTTTARMILGLEDATSGEVLIGGKHLADGSREERHALRRSMQPVFQDPYGSLNPMYSVESLVNEPLRVFGVGDRASRHARVKELLDQVALPSSMLDRRPGELSGGQRQRVAIARALALEPPLMICDEAVSALDVLVQDQILTLLRTLQDELGLTLLFITHDLAVVRLIAENVVVMDKGKVMEAGTVDDVFTSPESEYTEKLLASIPGAAFFA